MDCLSEYQLPPRVFVPDSGHPLVVLEVGLRPFVVGGRAAECSRQFFPLGFGRLLGAFLPLDWGEGHVESAGEQLLPARLYRDHVFLRYAAGILRELRIGWAIPRMPRRARAGHGAGA
jgi:hypothetical protein